MQQLYRSFVSPSLLLLSALYFVFAFAANAQLSIDCPGDILQGSDPGQCSAVVTYTPPAGTGSGTNITTSLTLGLASGEVFAVGVTEVQYTVTNDEGDSESCSFFVTVFDQEDPVFDCPDLIVVNAGQGECFAVVVFDAPAATDNCGVVSVSQFGGLQSGSFFPSGENSVDFQAIDAEGNSAFCRIVIEVIDSNDPFIICPDDITVEISDGCDAVVNYTAPEGSAECLESNTTQTGGLGSGATFPLGTTVETYTVVDLAGRTASCSFNINVVDVAPPVISCPGNIDLMAAAGTCEAMATFDDALATDNCPDVVISQTGGLPSGEMFPAGINTVTYTATDASGNESTCSFTITVTEDMVPEIVCPANIVANTDVGECTAVVNYIVPQGTDNCPGASTALSSGLGSGAAFPIGVTTEEYTVTDASGNTATCSFTIEVQDAEAPEINCLETLEVTAPEGSCEATVNFDIPTFSDNCPGGSIIQTDGPASGSNFPVGDTQIEFTAIDAAENPSTCILTITVIDEEDPEITCPADVEVILDEANCEGLVSYSDPVASDNCPGVSFALTDGPESGTVVQAGDYTVTFVATDASNNTATCSFNLSVLETNNPEFLCPADLEVDADPGACEAEVTFDTPTASDPCSDVTVTQTAGPTSGSVFPAGSTTVQFTAEDEFGNTSTCSFTIIVMDDTAPSIACPANIELNNDPGECGAIVNYALPEASDICGDVSLTLLSGPASGDFVPVGSATVTYQATDISGNAATCSFVIEVMDAEAPEITCPDNLDIVLADGECEAVVNYAIPTAMDNCAVASITLAAGPASGDIFQVGTTIVSYEATDAVGNMTTCSFSVTLTENVPPTIDCPANIEASNEPGSCGATVSYQVPVGVDGCPGASTALTEGLGSGAFFPVGTTIETYTVTDLSGNSSQCSFTVTVIDSETPVFECPDNIAVPNNPGNCKATISYSAPQVTDNCDENLIPVLISGPATGSLLNVGVYTVVYEVSDAADNTATCSFTITVEDTEGPEINCPNDIEFDTASGDCDAVVVYDLPTATDNCGVATIELIDGLPSGSLFPVGVNTITFEVTDVNGLTANCSFTITVNELDPPMIDCPANVVQPNDPGQCGALVDYDLPEVSDACGEATLSLTEGPAPGAFFPEGITEVTYTATDASGNAASCTFTVTVLDAEAPVLDCPAVTIVLNNDEGLCGAIYTFEIPSANDNCDDNPVVTQTGGPASGSFLPLGDTVFEFSAIDADGNSASCSYTVSVIDNEAPLFSNCPDDITANIGEGECTVQINFMAPEALDNCDVEVVQSAGPLSGESLAPGSYVVSFEASDPSGNVAVCSFNVLVVDTIAPEFACPEGFETCNSLIEFDFPIATDNCSEVEVIQTEGPANGSFVPPGVYILSFLATDESGNTATCIFEIEVLQAAPRAEVGANLNICGNSTAILVGNDPDFAFGTWILVNGFGLIADPGSPITQVTELGVGSNVFVWSINPQNGCEVSTDTLTITVEPGVTINAGQDQSIMAGGQASLLAIVQPPGGSFIWQPDNGLSCVNCPNPVASPDVTTQYFVTYTTLLGCSVTDSVTVRVSFELPNTITPNDDGVNDVWNIPGIEEFPNAQVVIYNRWGNEIYSSTGYEEPWDGKRNGEHLPAGSYFYIIDYQQDGKENLNGTVNIIR